MTPHLKKYLDSIDEIQGIEPKGTIQKLVGLVVESRGPLSSIGDLCCVHSKNGDDMIPAEVVGFKEDSLLLMPLGDLSGVSPGSVVTTTGAPYKIGVGENLLGRILDGFGHPLDGHGLLKTAEYRQLVASVPNPLTRRRISQPLWTGVRAIDGVITLGQGQRIGIFSGSGIGKSVLLGMIARKSSADVHVIALIGERGREVREFIEKDLGKEGLARSVVVAVTSDKPAVLRLQGTKVAITLSEYFRDRGLNVLLMMDSITRVAIAQREVGLSVGEPPTTKGYPPSVFALMPQLLERAGTSHSGCITGIYTVLVEGDDVNEPVSDTVRAILDGHIVLSRDLANRGHYPPIDPLQSVSRVMIDVVDKDHLKDAMVLRELVSTYRDAQDLINIGAYVKGTNPSIDRSIEHMDGINKFLVQGIDEKVSSDDMRKHLSEVVS